ncbi:MAG: Gfo/Idh/MocA family protein [Armatimonadota bacterium]
MSISVGIVGLGQFGTHFVKLFRDHPDVGRLALCDLRADRVAACAEEFGIEEAYGSLDEACAADLDALAIITQPWHHAAHAIQALEAGKHVYCAVPPATAATGEEALEQCDHLVNTVERTGQTYMLGETTFFRRETIYCRARAAAGDFGEFVYAEGEYFHDMSHGLYEVAEKRWGEQWSRHKSGGAPMHYPTHSTSGVVSVMGAHMTEVSAQGYIHPNDDWFRADTVSGNLFSNEVALYRMSNGALARICEFRRIGHPGREGFRIYGTEGSFENDVSGAKWATKSGWEPVDLSSVCEPLPPALAADLGGHGGSHAYLVHEFVDACTRPRLPRINVWEAMRYLAPGIAAHQSALRDGEVVKVADWGDAPE